MGKPVYLADLLLDTKDGDWGLDKAAEEHSAHFVIRGADFPSVRLGNMESVPLRHLPDRSVWRRTLRPNDILFETAGGTRDRPTGRSLLITEAILDQFDGPVIGASFTRFLRPDPSKVDPRYLFWYLQYLYSLGEMYKYQVQHTGVARFQYTVFAGSKELYVANPNSQVACSLLLGALDDKIVANNRIVEAADHLAGALFRQSQASDVQTSLQAVAEITMGSSPPGSSYNEIGSGIPFYQGVRDFGIRTPSQRVWTTAPDRTCNAGDTLLSVRAPVGRLNLAGEHLCLGRGLAGLRSRMDRPLTLFHQIRAAQGVWSPYNAEGTVFGSINRANLETIAIPTVRSECEVELEAQLSAVEAVISSAVRENAQLEQTRDKLLPLLISGRIGIAEGSALL